MNITEISSLLTSIKAASEILSVLKNADNSFEKAELKFKLSEAMSALADVKMEAAKIQDVILKKDERIKELEKAIELKAKVIREGYAYYEMNENGTAVGDPYCSHCWEVNNRLVHLHRKGFMKICPLCKNEYEARLTSKK